MDPISDFDLEGQQAFFLYQILPDIVEGMAGLWLGKNFSGLSDIMNIYNMEKKKEILDYLFYMIQIARIAYNEERERSSKLKR